MNRPRRWGAPIAWAPGILMVCALLPQPGGATWASPVPATGIRPSPTAVPGTTHGRWAADHRAADAEPTRLIGHLSVDGATRVAVTGLEGTDRRWLAPSPSRDVDASTDAGTIAYLTSGPAGLVVVRAGRATVVAPGTTTPPDVSPDGLVLTWGQGRRVLSTPVPAASRRTLWRAPGRERPSQVALSPDGSRLLVVTRDQRRACVLRVVRTGSGREVWQERGRCPAAGPDPDPTPTWAPDSRRALLRWAGRSGVASVVTVGRDGGLAPTPLPAAMTALSWRSDGIWGLRGDDLVRAAVPRAAAVVVTSRSPAGVRLSHAVPVSGTAGPGGLTPDPGPDPDPAPGTPEPTTDPTTDPTPGPGTTPTPGGTATPTPGTTPTPGGTPTAGTTPTPGGTTAPPAPGSIPDGTQTVPGGRLDVGDPVLQDLWVDPRTGSDDASGRDRDHALATVTEAWSRVPAGEPLTRGVAIRLVAGHYPASALPTYWEHRWGSHDAPVVVVSADGPLAARLSAGIDLYDSSWIRFEGIDVDTAGDPFHCAQCRDVLLRRVRLDGNGAAQETLKANQSTGLHVEDSELADAYQNALDFVAVQHAVVVGNRIHGAGDWCAYVKGGSAYVDVVGNEFHDCDTGGFSAGQGTGFEYMTPPWIRYETYGVRVVNNLIHHTVGAGLGVNGSHNVLLAHNTMYAVGSRSHAIEVVHGARSCDGDTAACAARLAAGGWGVTGDGGGQWIPNRNVWVLNNVVHDPMPLGSAWSHLAVAAPAAPPDGSGVPSPSYADDGLVFAGNIWWNGPADLDLGVGLGCPDGHPTCSAARIRADNLVNVGDPGLMDPAGGDLRPAPGGLVDRTPAVALPQFEWSDSGVPAGAVATTVTAGFDGQPRPGAARPGAW